MRRDQRRLRLYALLGDGRTVATTRPQNDAAHARLASHASGPPPTFFPMQIPPPVALPATSWPRSWADYLRPTTLAFLAVHAVAIAGASARLLVAGRRVAIGIYFARMVS